jgi:hypothetical protein
MPDIAPNSDISAPGWTAVPSGQLYTTIDEASASDADYIYSPISGISNASFGLASPISAGTQQVSFRMSSTSLSPANVRIRFLDSLNVSVGVTADQPLTATLTTYTLAVVLSNTATRVRVEVTPGSSFPIGVLSLDGNAIALDAQYISFV